MIGRLEIVILVVAASLASGCGGAIQLPTPTLGHGPQEGVLFVDVRTHPDLLAKTNNIDRVLILPPRVAVFLLAFDNKVEKMDEWTEQAKGHVLEALEGELRSRSGLLINTLSEVSLPKDVQSNLEETQALFDLVDSAIYPACSTQPHHQGPYTPGPPPVGMASEIAIFPFHVFPEKLTVFSYSLGSEVGALDAQADALVLVRAVDHISSIGRKLKFLLLPLCGFGCGGVRFSGETLLCITLFDARTGDILWHNVQGLEGIYDLREADSTTSLVKFLLEDFPIQ